MKENPCQGGPRLEEALIEYQRTDTLGSESRVAHAEAAQVESPEEVPAGQTITRYRLRLVRETEIPYDRRVSCDNPSSAAAFLHHVTEGLDREVLGALLVDGRHHAIGHTFAYVGTLHSAVAEPRGILVPALLANAAAVILFHNHPSGDPDPSKDDIELTKRMEKAGDLLGVRVLDHIILGEPPKYVSLLQRRTW